MQSQRQVTPREQDEVAPAREQGLWRVWGDVRRSAEQAFHPGMAPPTSRVGQFIHGLGLPFQLIRTLLAHPGTRRRYLAVSLTQVAVIVGLAVLFTGSSKGLVESAVAGEPPARERTFHWLVYAAALLSSLHISQWVVIALSRDFHTELSREASLLTGLTPEDEPMAPRVRLNVGWMRNKLKRRWRALLVFGAGVPLLYAIGWALPQEELFLPVMLSLWGAWWFVVYTAGKSALAWNEPAPREPWFLRGWTWLSSRLVPLRLYGAVWTRMTRSVFAPVASVERRPWGFAGLALVRALAMLPLVKCFLRPVIPVAAAHLIVAEGTAPAVESAGERQDGSAPAALS